jgi:hypothetical protein
MRLSSWTSPRRDRREQLPFPNQRPEAEFLVEKPGTKTGLLPGFFVFSSWHLLSGNARYYWSFASFSSRFLHSVSFSSCFEEGTRVSFSSRFVKSGYCFQVFDSEKVTTSSKKKTVTTFSRVQKSCLWKQLPLFTKWDENETRVPSSKQEENETNWRNREENETNDQKYRALPESRCQEENTKKPGSKLVLVPGFSTKNSASGGHVWIWSTGEGGTWRNGLQCQIYRWSEIDTIFKKDLES